MYSDEVRREWAERSGEYSPAYYAYRGADDISASVRAILTEHLTPDASVIELGCGPGRHLSHLQEAGFSALSGIDVNTQAFEVMAEEYPELAETVTFYGDTIESVVPTFDDDQFDAVFSVETLQHIHPDEAWVFEEIARVAGDLLVTVEIEGTIKAESDDEERTDDRKDSTDGGEQRAGDDPQVNYVREDVPLYYRDWKTVFTEFGFDQVHSETRKRDTVRIFRPT